MREFGQTLRYYRRQSRDPHRGGHVTQARFADLLHNLTGFVYSHTSISYWENNKSHINPDNRPLLIGIIQVLCSCQGIQTLDEANHLLHAGNYRSLNKREIEQIQINWLTHSNDSNTSTITPEKIHNPPASSSWSQTKSNPMNMRVRQILLKKVHMYWITGLLEPSLSPLKHLELDVIQKTDVLEYPWMMKVASTSPLKATISPETSLLNIALQFNGFMLILGEAGSGKTTALLTLARDLINQAQTDPMAPIPIILNLSSWAQKQLSLSEWLIEELHTTYSLNPQYTKQWLPDEPFWLLLDGLDEIPANCRQACVQAINVFQKEYNGLTRITVCSRLNEYKQLNTKLQLLGAVAIEPLDSQLINIHLAKMGKPESFWHHLRPTNLLEEPFIQTPLFLSIIARASQNTSFSSPNYTAQPQNYSLLEAYIQGMFTHKENDKNYSSHQVLNWLGWLARQMKQQRQTIFHIEYLQPDWLSKSEQHQYMWITSLLTWLVLSSVFSVSYGALIGLWAGILVCILCLCLGTGMTIATYNPSVTPPYWPKQPLKRSLIYGTLSGLFGLLGTIFIPASVFSIENNLMFRATIGLCFTVVGSLSTKQKETQQADPIVLVEKLQWSRRHINIPSISLYTISATLITLLLTGRIGISLIAGNSVLLFGTTLSGLKRQAIAKKSSPNQGIHHTMRHTIMVTLLTIGVIAFTLSMAFGTNMVIHSVWGLIVGLQFGGLTLIQHLTLRWILHKNQKLPWQLITFLEKAVMYTFLQKVGGGYVFMHRTLLEHLADRNEHEH